MDNPSFSNTTGVSMTGENFVNDPKPNISQGKNKFNRSYPHFTTARYGDVTPFYVDDTVERDEVPLSSRHVVRTPTMVSVFEGDLVMKKAYFDVPLRAIYPLNYDIMKVPPVAGDDVPDDTMSYIPVHFFQALASYLSSYRTSDVKENVILLLLLEKFISRSSLFDYLGFHMSNCYSSFNLAGSPFDYDSTKRYSFDLVFELIAQRYFTGIDLENGGYGLCIHNTRTGHRYAPYAFKDSVPVSTAYTLVPARYILELLRDNPFEYNMSLLNFSGESVPTDDFFFDIISDFGCQFPLDNINIERIVAYQLAMAEYMTDDHIDSVYTTDLFRQMFRSYSTDIYNLTTSYSLRLNNYFVRNGVEMQYDVFSAHTIEMMAYCLEEFIYSGKINDLFTSGISILYYWWNLLSIRKSLRFEDYFVGGRLHPLALGDTNVPVVGNNVDVYEIIKGIVYTRYLNSVNLSGSSLEPYSKEVLKNTPPPRNDIPKLLGMTRSSVSGYEVENTSSVNQGNIVTNVRSSDERYAFNVVMDHDSVVIGVCFFESRRFYSQTGERSFYISNRDDRFNPRTQYLGDQPISLAELRVGSSFDEPFAYGVRNNDLKQRVGVVSGGVVDFLPSWVMVTDIKDSYDNEDSLNSDYIRSKNAEFDRFFNTSNVSLGGYFHFILSFMNESEPIRPMDVAPAPLL